jgi:1-acyl-sn-glycerol-3-phosphate acyltransferase
MIVLAKFVVHMFFSRIEVVGKHNLEKVEEGAVIFVGNHANQVSVVSSPSAAFLNLLFSSFWMRLCW